MRKNIKKIFCVVQLVLFLSVSSVSAQNTVPVVTNVDLQQRTDYTLIVDIYYDVFDADEDTMTVTMFASSDSGATWNLTCNNITGAIGSGITNGTGNQIVWSIGVEHPNFFSNKVIVEISADDGRLSAPALVSPPNNMVFLAVAPTLIWTANAAATSYTLQVSESTVFTSCFYNQSGLVDTSQQIIGLNDSTIYFWRVSAANNSGTSSFSNTWSFSTAPQPCPGIPTITFSGKIYNTVQIANKCWVKENLDVGVYIASTIFGSTHSDVSNNGVIEKYCYENNESNCATYGGLYDWNEAMGYITTSGTQGICPPGWHIPTINELDALKAGVNNNSNSLKALGQGSGSGAGTNTSGFTALVAGYRYGDGHFTNLGMRTVFWSSSMWNSTNALALTLNNWDSYIYLDDNIKENGFSIRCLKD